MAEFEPRFLVSDVQVAGVPGVQEGARRFEGRVVVQDPNETVDSYGTLKQVFRDRVADDPFQAVHGALQEAAREVDPTVPRADLLSTGAVHTLPNRALPNGGYRGEARFRVGKKEVPSVGFHPTNEQAARLDAVVKGNQRLHLYTK